MKTAKPNLIAVSLPRLFSYKHIQADRMYVHLSTEEFANRSFIVGIIIAAFIQVINETFKSYSIEKPHK